MALDDAFGVDPNQVLDDVVRQHAPDLTDNGVVDPNLMMDRLIKKHIYKQPGQQQPKQPKLNTPEDYKSFGREPEGPVDFGSFGREGEPSKPAETAQPQQQGSGWSVGEGASVFGRSTAQGAVKAVGAIPKAAALGPEMEKQAYDQIHPENLAGTDQSGAADELVPPPFRKEAKSRERQQAQAREDIAERMKTPVQERPAYKAGKAVQDWADKAIPVSPEERAKYPITSQAGSLIGGAVPAVGAGIATSAVAGPAAGTAVAAGIMGAQSAGDEFDRAAETIDKRIAQERAAGYDDVADKLAATRDERAAKAAGLSAVLMGTTGAMPVGVILAPAKTIAPGAVGRLWYMLDHAFKSGVTFTGVGEAQHYIGEQLAKEYDPNAKYDFDYKRLIAEFLAGGALGAGHAAIQRRPEVTPPPPPPDTPPGPDTGLPPPGPGHRPDTGPDTGPGPGAPSRGEAWRAKWDSTPPPTEAEKSRLQRSALRTVFKEKYGFTDEDLANASMADLRSFAADADFLQAQGVTPAEVAKMTPREMDEAVASHHARYADDVLRRAGYSDEDIRGMDATVKKETAAEMRGYGVHAGAEPPKAGTREAPVDLKTAEDVKAAAGVIHEDASHAQHEAHNIQLGHGEWEGLGLTFEVRAGSKRKGVAPDGKTYETDYAADYGYFKGLPKGADGDAPDFYLGKNPAAKTAYVIDELSQTGKNKGKFKQTKSMLGFDSEQDAVDGYLGTTTKSRKSLGAVTAIPREEFVEYAKAGKLSTPAATTYRPKAAEIAGNAGIAAEAAPEHVKAVEDRLAGIGERPKDLEPPDLVQRAARLHAQGMTPEDAIQVALVKAAIEKGVFTEEQAKQLYGKVIDILHAGEPSERELPAAPSGAAARGQASKAEQVGSILPGGGEAGEGAQGVAGAEAGGRADRTAAADHPEGRGVSALPVEPAGRERAAGRGGPAEAGRDRTQGTAGGAAAAGPAEDAAAVRKDLIGARVTGLGVHNVTAGDGTAVRVVPVVVEAKDLITSSDKGYDKRLQPRERERAASQAQIREIATRLDPERLGYSAEADRGAPIVGPDRMVESGNGRVAALRAVYKVNPTKAKAYRDWLTDQGVDVAKYKEPVLVRQRMTALDDDQRRGFTVASNQAATLAMSAPERAAADAKYLTPDMIGQIKADNLNAAENRPFIRSFIGAIPASERGALATAEGALSAEGLARARNAILAKAYGDPDVLARITESTDDDVKSISNALVMAAPAWARLRSDVEAGRVGKDLDLTDDLMEAVKRTAELRGRGEKLDDFLAQQDAFDKLPGPVEGFMRMFYDGAGRRAAGAPRIASGLRFYAEEAAKATTEAKLDLGVPEVKADDIQAAAAKEVEVPASGAGVRPSNEPAGRSERGQGTAARRQEPSAGRERGPRRYGLAQSTNPFSGTSPSPSDRTRAGDQFVFPGGERITTAELARRRIAEPLRARKEQKPADFGLFGAPEKQADIVEEARKHERSDLQPAGVRPAAPAAPATARPFRPRRASKPGAIEQLSLFGGPSGSEPVREHPVTEEQRPGRAEPAVSPEGGEVTKPPARSQRAGDGRNRAPAKRGIAAAQQKIEERSRLNYRITDDDKVGVGGPKEKVRANLEAIRTLKALEEEARNPTAEEKAKLVRYSGWGAFAQAMFKEGKPEWKDERDALRAVLTKDEYEAARASTLNAHFTSPDVIRGMWDALDHLGYDGGLALEPAAGVGHFIGLTPDKVAGKTAWTATELDPITGRIAKALYGGAEVNVQGYEELKRPSNYYDLAISNVPFGDYNISEKPYGSFPIHDFFFVKSLDKVRPGGVVAFVTSRYTLDRVDPGTRRLLARTADLVGAIRLPGGKKGAFSGNAGTEVTTDVLFLRKKVPGEAPFPGASWHDLKEVQTPDGPVSINEYFADHPEMMLGEMRLAGTMYRADEPVLLGPTEGLREKIADAAANMPAGAFLPRGKPPPETLSSYDMPGLVKDGAFFLKGDKLFRNERGEGKEQQLSKDDHDRVRRLAGIRDTINELLDAQLKPGTGNTEALRKKLRAAYDAFVRAHGPINRETRTVTARIGPDGEPLVITRVPNFAKFRPDPDAWKVAAIERYDAETDTAKPADIQTKDVIDAPRERQVNGPADALAAALDAKGSVDLDHIAESLGLDSHEAVVHALGDLVYVDPDGRQWQTADRYLSGDVVKKLEDARVTAQEDKTYQRNVEALEKVQPLPLSRHDIYAAFGAPWVPASHYEAFFKDVLGASTAKVERVPITGEFKVNLGPLSRDAFSKYGTERVEPIHIARAAINNRQVTVFDEGPDKTRVVNAKATEEARIRTEALKEAFSGDLDHGGGWIWNDEARAQELEAIYNRTYNNLVPRKFDGSHLTFPGLNRDFATRQHRKDAVWRMVQQGNTLLAHVVGSGKTVTMIAGGMEMKRLGLINKPAYAVPNHMLEQFSREFIQAYPNAKILVASKDETSAENRKAFVAKVASNDWDGVIITHDAFGRLNMGKEFRRQHIMDQLDELDRALDASVAEGERNSPTVKELEKVKKRLKDKLDKLMNEERKDEGVTFEETGIDHLFVDEAHKFKNLSFITRLSRVKGLANSASQRAEDLFLKMRYLEGKRPGRSAVFATGTPVSNTMAELWTMMRYLQLDRLKQRDLDVFDSWASTFGRVQSNMELSADGRTMQEVASFSRFVNIPELIGLYSEIADTKTADMLNLPRPEVRTRSGAPGVEIVEAEPSSQEEAFIQDLVKLAESMKGKRPKPGEPNMLSVVTMGRKVATDGRLISPNYDFNPQGKAAKAIENIHRIWNEGKAPGLVQMVFLDMGVPQTRAKAKPKPADLIEGEEVGGESANQSRYDLYSDIKQRLVAKGIPAKDIAFIHDADNDDKKARLFKAVRAGKVRVIFGSSEKMGVGTNVQDQLIAMHHIDAPWKPAEVEQRDGRIVRQGNQNKAVQIYRYVTRRSFDAFMWQTLDRKAKFIGQVLSGAKGSRHAEDIDNPLPEAAEMKAAASGDPRILEHAEADRVVRQLEAQRRAFENARSSATWEMKAATSRIEQYERALPDARVDAAKVQDVSGDRFKVELGGKPYTDRREAGQKVLVRFLEREPYEFFQPKMFDVGTMSGFKMKLRVSAQYDGSGDGYILRGVFSLEGQDHYSSPHDLVLNKETDPIGVMRRYENLLTAIRGERARLELGIKTERENAVRLGRQLKETWPKDKELKAAIEKRDRLVRALSGEERAFLDRAVASIDPEAFATAIEHRAKNHPELPPIRNAKEAVDALLRDLEDMRSRPTTEPIMDTPARRQLQKDIALRLYDQAGMAQATPESVVPRRSGRRADLVLGPPASGKSHHLVAPLLRGYGAVLLDADEAKLLLPEFDNGRGAGVVHEESARITEDLLREHAMVPGDNIVQPMIGKNLMKINGLITSYSDAGYKVHLHFVDLDIAKALGRALSRYVSGGRLLDPHYIDSVDHLPQAVFDQIKERPDVASYQVVSTDVPFGEPARLVETSGEPQAYPGLGGRGAPGAGEGVRPAEEGGQAPPEIGGFAEAGDVYSGASGAASDSGHLELDPTELRALRWYSEHGPLISALLRKTSPKSADPQARKAAESWLPVLDGIFKRAHWNEEGTVVYRGGSDTRLRGLEVGETIEDAGFISTSRRLDVAKDFAERRGERAAMMSIEIPRGAHAVSVFDAGDRSDAAWSMREVLLDRGSRLRLKAIEGRNYRFELEQDSPGLAQPSPTTRDALAKAVRARGALGSGPSGGAGYVDLGPFVMHDGAGPIAKQAKDYVVARGRETGLEHVVGIDDTGAVIAHTRGTETRADFSPDLESRIKDERQSIVLHHNHPNNTGLSSADISMLIFPGLRAVWAHGHNGASARASLTPEARRALEGRYATPERARATLDMLARATAVEFFDPFRRAIDGGLIDKDKAWEATVHITNTALGRAGIIDHRDNVQFQDIIDKFGLEPYIDRAARQAAGSLFQNAQTPTAHDVGVDGAEPLRHRGDLGALLSATPPDAGPGQPDGGKRDRARRKSDRAEAAGQLRLPGFKQAERFGEEGARPSFDTKYEGDDPRGALAAVEESLRNLDTALPNYGDRYSRYLEYKRLTKWRDALREAARELGLSETENPYAPPFYSAVERAVQSSKQPKAAPNHWLNTIKNTPGVKPEEIESLDLQDWLRAHKGPVTKQELADYIRANSIEVREVERGGEVPAEAIDAIRDWLRGGSADAYVSDADLEALRTRRDAEALGNLESLGVPNELLAPLHDADQPGASKFAGWTLSGGKNHRELLMTLPSEALAHGASRASARGAREINERLIEKYGGLHEAFSRWTNAEEEEFHRLHGAAAGRNEYHRDYNPPTGHQYGDEAADTNRVAHIFMDDRVIDGKRTLLVKEMQSDWHQKGRKQGYISPAERAKFGDELEALNNRYAAHRAKHEGIDDAIRALREEDLKIGLEWSGNVDQNRHAGAIQQHMPGFGRRERRNAEIQARRAKIAADIAVLEQQTERLREFERSPERKADAARWKELEHKLMHAVPDAPFKTTWPELILKRMIRYAAERGYEQLAWVPGQERVDAYDLSKHIGRITWVTRPDDPPGKGVLAGYSREHDGRRQVMEDKWIDAAELPDHVGKEAAERLLARAPAYGMGRTEIRTLEGLDLKVGGQGMLGFYDDILPKAANKIVKKYGAKVGRARLTPQGDLIIRSELDQRGEVVGQVEVTDRDESFHARFDTYEEAQDYANLHPNKAHNVHTVGITPALRDTAVHQGFALFQPENPFEEPRTTEEGFVLRLPFAERWGNPRFNPEDKQRALNRLEEIQTMPVRDVPWSDLIEARRDINEIFAQLYYFKPDMTDERIRGSDEAWLYMWAKRGGKPDSITTDPNPEQNPEVFDLARAGKNAIEHLLSGRRRGVLDLLTHANETEPGGGPQPGKIGEKQRSGFYFAAGRKLAEVPDALFKQSGQAVLNWLRQAGVKRSEIEHFGLQEKFGNRQPTTRAAFQNAIAERMFDFRRKTSWLNPEWSKRDYELGGTRAFTGPRIPGRGVYFERLMAFPRKLKGGETFPPGMFETSHWDMPGTWAAWRGSVREVPGFGKMVVGEEGQSDFMQGAFGRDPRRPRITHKDFLAAKAERGNYQVVRAEAQQLIYSIPYRAEGRDKLISDLWPGNSNVDPETWQKRLGDARAAIRLLDVDSWGAIDEVMKNLDKLAALRAANEKFWAPDASAKYSHTESSFTPETPIDQSYVRTMVRDLIMLAAQKKADSIAISTSETTNRIQANTWHSAAHFYDNQLKPALERELRKLGDPSITLQKVQLPKAMGPKARPYTVWAAKLPAKTHETVSEGLALFETENPFGLEMPKPWQTRWADALVQVARTSPWQSELTHGYVRDMKPAPRDGKIVISRSQLTRYARRLPARDIEGLVGRLPAADVERFQEALNNPRRRARTPKPTAKTAQGEIAQILADQPLQPKKPQTSEGFFEDGGPQQLKLLQSENPYGKEPSFEGWHGSSAEHFTHFDLSHIGTGEGTSSRGHGVYIAGARGAGEYYRDFTTDAVRARRRRGESVAPALYQVRVHADHGLMLDLDRPLREQPRVLDRIERDPVLSLQVDPEITGEMFRLKLEDELAMSPEGVSEMFNGAGIPGFKYLDEFSREGAVPAEQTRNFVIFDPKRIEITHKNGEPVAPIGLSQSENPYGEPGIYRGVHQTGAEFKQITDRKLAKRDAGYWGRGFYLFPYDYAKDFGERNVRLGGEGVKLGWDTDRSMLLAVDAKKPFVIENVRAVQRKVPEGGFQAPGFSTEEGFKGNFDELAQHGWPYKGPPVHAWGKIDAIHMEAVRARADAIEKEKGIKHLDAFSQALNEVERPPEINEKGQVELARQFTDALLKAGYDLVVVKDDNEPPYEMVAIAPGTVRPMFGGRSMWPRSKGEDLGLAQPENPYGTVEFRGIKLGPEFKAIGDGEGAFFPTKESIMRATGVAHEVADALADYAQWGGGSTPEEHIAYNRQNAIDAPHFAELHNRRADILEALLRGEPLEQHGLSAQPPQLGLSEGWNPFGRSRTTGRTGTGAGTPPPGAGAGTAGGGAGGGTAAGGGGAGAAPPGGGAAATAAPTPSGRGRPITGALMKTGVAKAFKNFWTSNFQPELFSDRALEADPLFARYKAATTQEKDALIHTSESEWGYWNKRSFVENLRFMDEWERGMTPADRTQAGMMRRYKRIMDANYAEDRATGLDYGYIAEYLPHIWEKPDEWRAFAETRTAQVGPTWFQKKRFYEFIEDGLNAGLKLKYTNVIDLVVHRLSSSVDARQRMQLLYDLKRMGLAWEGAGAGTHLVARGWRAINAPDRQQWVLAPDVLRLWQNAVEAKGLWQAEHLGGGLFRGWMALKTAWVPIKLALSAFHPLHVLHIAVNDTFARAWGDITKGKDPVQALKTLAQVAEPFTAAPGATTGAIIGSTLGAMTPVGPIWGGIAGSIVGATTYGAAKRMGMPDIQTKGKKARKAWATRPSAQTPEQRAMVTLMKEGGFVPQLSEQLKIAAKRQLAEAFHRIRRREGGVSDWRRFVSAAFRRPIEILQGPIFEQWIPNIKAAAYLNEAAALLRRRPDLLTNDTHRRIALRAIGQQVDSRFGEKFYGTMFWNRTLKDAAIGSFLSLGWNYGFVQQYGGAVMEAVTRPLGVLPPFRPSEGRKTIRYATNKIPGAIFYMGTAALLAALITALYTGEDPKGLDFTFPRIGGENPDGSPRRTTTMFYSREIPMLLKHIQERGGNVLSGTWEMVSNKLMFEPFKELINNRDYYGYNVWDENAPVYQQFWQALKHILGEQTHPMSVTGGKHAAEVSGKPFRGEPETWLKSLTAKGVPESMLGFGPAPAYVEKTKLQNRISYLYREHVSPSSRPEEEGANMRDKMAVRTAIMIARKEKDSKALNEAFKRGKELGMTQDAMNKVGRDPSDLYLFSRLPNSDQKAILRDASADEYKRYFPRAHQVVKTEINRQKIPAGTPVQ